MFFQSRITHYALLITCFVLLAVWCAPLTVNAQKRDNLTEQESDVVREAQEMDERMKVYVKIIDRRLLALSDANATASKQAQKDVEKWGELRGGTQAELFYDIQKTLDEAILKIDDVAARDQKNPLFSKGVHILADACKQFAAQFQSLRSRSRDERESVMIANAIDECNQIIEASSKVAKEIPKDKKKKN